MSFRGQVILYTVTILGSCYFIALSVMQQGPIHWLNEWQAGYLRGKYYPAASIVAVVVPVTLIGLALAVLHDYLCGLGQFSADDDRHDSKS